MSALATMLRMRDLTRIYQLTARSIPEITEGLELALSRYGGSREVLFRKRKLSSEALVNAAVLLLLEMPPRQQAREVKRAVKRLEQLLSEPPAKGGFGRGEALREPAGD